MVDFAGMADKAKSMVSDNSDKIKEGITKAGDFVGGKIGHDKVDPIEEKLSGLVDKVGGETRGAAAADPQPVPPVTPPATPPAQPATPPAQPSPPTEQP